MIKIFEKFQSIINKVIVEKYDVERNSFRLIVMVTFINNSTLKIREYYFENLGKRKYSYHWMDESNKLICRWDNTEHWKNIETFPHHVHIKDPGNVEPSRIITIDDVLKFIQNEIL